MTAEEIETYLDALAKIARQEKQSQRSQQRSQRRTGRRTQGTRRRTGR